MNKQINKYMYINIILYIVAYLFKIFKKIHILSLPVLGVGYVWAHISILAAYRTRCGYLSNWSGTAFSLPLSWRQGPRRMSPDRCCDV